MKKNKKVFLFFKIGSFSLLKLLREVSTRSKRVTIFHFWAYAAGQTAPTEVEAKIQILQQMQSGWFYGLGARVRA